MYKHEWSTINQKLIIEKRNFWCLNVLLINVNIYFSKLSLADGDNETAENPKKKF